ncbi:MAG: SAM-dependent DNA methyltransferase [Candidatus Lokiarchaeota archaeon]|nr:SAM-dependent DNA methyltransferase [Candidatus Lokiarchaeota archaeon]
MGNKAQDIGEKAKRRKYGQHLTSFDIFYKHILPEIKNLLRNYLWVDLYAGEGNLILPILKEIQPEDRETFFKEHIFLADVHEEMVKKCMSNAESYGISNEIASANIKLRDNLESFPQILKRKKHPIFHITNPPYLYLGYIKKHKETQNYLDYFKNDNEGYQDLYQIAMINDLRNKIGNLIYVIPSNFLFGASVSNKVRRDFLKYYRITKMIIFETSVFEFTGTNICISFFNRKTHLNDEIQSFKAIKFKNKNTFLNREYHLTPKYKYRAGSEFDEFLEEFTAHNSLKISYYLQNDEVLKNSGPIEISVIDANKYENNHYRKLILKVNKNLQEKLHRNILYVRTVDTGSVDGRAGLGIIKEHFGVNGIYVSGNTYRTHPIQIFLNPELSFNDQLLLRNYFNIILEHFREKLDSEFLTTYKYSNANYTRKYLGLTQVRGILETFPYELEVEKKKRLKALIEKGSVIDIIKMIGDYKTTQKV